MAVQATEPRNAGLLEAIRPRREGDETPNGERSSGTEKGRVAVKRDLIRVGYAAYGSIVVCYNMQNFRHTQG